MNFLTDIDFEKKSLQMLYLFTPQHTGTHFCRTLLETHPQITPCVYLEMMRSVEAHSTAIKYLRGSIGLNDWKRAVVEELRYRKSELAERFAVQFKEWGVYPPEKKDIRYLFFHNHISISYFRGFKIKNHEIFDNFRNIQVVITLRDPLLAIISALRRTNNGPMNAAVILKGIEYAAHLKSAHFYCVDLWSDFPEKKLKIFSDLGLEIPAAAEDFVKRKPVVNLTLPTQSKVLAKLSRIVSLLNPKNKNSSIQVALENTQAVEYMPPLDARESAKWREAKEMLVKHRKVHPALKPWVRVLQKHAVFEEFYRRLGYQNLVWFK